MSYNELPQNSGRPNRVVPDVGFDDKNEVRFKMDTEANEDCDHSHDQINPKMRVLDRS